MKNSKKLPEELVPGNDTAVIVSHRLRLSNHGVGLAGAGLPVGHDADVGRVVDKLGHQILNGAPVHRGLAGIRIESRVKSKGLGQGHHHLTLRLVNVQDKLGAGGLVGGIAAVQSRDEGPGPDVDLDSGGAIQALLLWSSRHRQIKVVRPQGYEQRPPW